MNHKSSYTCPVFGKCGGCQLLGKPYEKQLQEKKQYLESLFPGETVEEVLGMEDPVGYRCKVQRIFEFRKGQVIAGNYEAHSHRLVPVDSCLLEDPDCDAILSDIQLLVKKFHLPVYDPIRRQGVLRYVLIRKGKYTGQLLVVLVTAGFAFPGKKNFVKALISQHPEITSIVQNLNTRTDSLILGSKNEVLYGRGYIVDELMGKQFRISASAFYQVNPAQTVHLYKTALEMTDLKGKSVLDAYCGTGTIGILASDFAKEVVGVEINPEAVTDAIYNAKANQVSNIRFIRKDASEYLLGDHVPDVVLMDPPRSGSTPAFLDAIATAGVKEIVYISCGPEALARDLVYLKQKGYEVKRIKPVDLFPFTSHVETVCYLYHQKKDFISVPYEPKNDDYLKQHKTNFSDET